MIKELVEYVVKQLVSQPDQVKIEVLKKGDERMLEISVSPEDRGRVIGKEGQTIKALRSLVEVIVPAGKKVFVDLVRSS